VSEPIHESDSSSVLAQTRAALDEQRTWDAPGACRTGVAKITANSGWGDYTVTEQRRRTTSGVWQDATEQLGYVDAEALDLNGLAIGYVGQVLPFAEHRAAGGEILLLIDVVGGGRRVKISANDTTGGHLGDKLVGDDGMGSNVKISFEEQGDGGNETIKAVIAKSDIPGSTDQRVAVVSGDSGDYLGNQVKTFAGDSTHVGVTLEVDGTGEAAKLQAKVAKSDIEAVASVETGFDQIITHTIKIDASTAAGEYTIDSADLRGKLLLHSSWAIATALGGNTWDGGTQGTTSPECWDVESSPSADVDLNYLAASTIKLIIDANDGKLKWTWWTHASDRYATCIIRVHNSIPDYTAS